jgi:hypothetical protein
MYASETPVLKAVDESNKATLFAPFASEVSVVPSFVRRTPVDKPVLVSTRPRRKFTDDEDAGPDLRTSTTETESVLAENRPLTEIFAAVVVSRAAAALPPTSDPDPAVVVTVIVGVAEEGATERTPRPNAATATSAMRLNVVFVDICFLSIVDLRNFRKSA